MTNKTAETDQTCEEGKGIEKPDIGANGDESDGDDIYVFMVEKIIGTKMDKDVRYYKVQWADSWEPGTNLNGCVDAIDAFWKRSGKSKPTEKEKNEDVTEVIVTEVAEVTEDSQKGYSLRKNKEENNRKKRKGGDGLSSKRSLRQKRRKMQDQSQSSSDEGSEKALEQSDDPVSENIGFDPAKYSPQVVIKKVLNKRRLTQKRKRISKELFSNSSDVDGGGGDVDGGGDGDDEEEDDNIPLENLVKRVSAASKDNAAADGCTLADETASETQEAVAAEIDDSTLPADTESILPADDIVSTAESDIPNEIALAPDVSAPDVLVPDISAPDVSAPDVSAPDVSAPDVSSADGSAPNVSAPDGSAPDISAPEVSAPDGSAHDGSARDGSVRSDCDTTLPYDIGSSITNESESDNIEVNVPATNASPPEDVPETPVATDVPTIATSTTIPTTTSTTIPITTSTTIPTTTPTTEERSNNRLRKQRLGRGTKWDAVLCSSGSDEEEDEHAVPPEEVKVKEEPISDEEEELFKRTAKIKAKHILQRYNETGGDANVDGDDYLPATIRREEEDTPYIPDVHAHIENNTSTVCNFNEAASQAAPVVPLNINNTCSTPNVTTARIDSISSSTCLSPTHFQQRLLSQPRVNIVPVSLPSAFVRPKDPVGMRSHGNTTQQPFKHAAPRVTTPSSSSVTTCTSSSPSSIVTSIQTVSSFVESSTLCTGIKQEDVENGPFTSSTNTNTTQCTQGKVRTSRGVPSSDIFTHASKNVHMAAPLRCEMPILLLSSKDLKCMVTRVLFLLKKLVEYLRLKAGLVQDYIRALVAKAVVVAIRESYCGNKYDPIFLEKQIHDFTQIVLKELPFERLMPLLHNYAQAYSNSLAQTPRDITHVPSTQAPIISTAKSNSSLSTVVAASSQPINTLPQTFNSIGIGIGTGGFVPPIPPNNTDESSHMFSPHAKRQSTAMSSFQSPPITSVRQPPMEGVLPPPHPSVGNVDESPQHVSSLNVPFVSQFCGANISANTMNTATASVTVTSNRPLPSVQYPTMESPPPITQINFFESDRNTDPLCSISSPRSLNGTEPVKKSPVVHHNSELEISKNVKNADAKLTPSACTTPVSCTSEKIKQSIVNNKQTTHATALKPVRGPHRFYRAPKKVHSNAVSKNVAGVSSQPNEVTLDGQNDVENGNTPVRYKDLVNQKFSSKPVNNRNKVIDLTDLTIGSDSDDDDDDEDYEEEEDDDDDDDEEDNSEKEESDEET